MFDELARVCHTIARDHGFWDHAWVGQNDAFDGYYNPSINAEKLALIHTEISEATDALRACDRDQEEEELADAIIRILDYCHQRGYSMDKAVAAKNAKNRDRPRLHGKAF